MAHGDLSAAQPASAKKRPRLRPCVFILPRWVTSARAHVRFPRIE